MKHKIKKQCNKIVNDFDLITEVQSNRVLFNDWGLRKV